MRAWPGPRPPPPPRPAAAPHSQAAALVGDEVGEVGQGEAVPEVKQGHGAPPGPADHRSLPCPPGAPARTRRQGLRRGPRGLLGAESTAPAR